MTTRMKNLGQPFKPLGEIVYLDEKYVPTRFNPCSVKNPAHELIMVQSILGLLQPWSEWLCTTCKSRPQIVKPQTQRTFRVVNIAQRTVF